MRTGILIALVVVGVAVIAGALYGGRPNQLVATVSPSPTATASASPAPPTASPTTPSPTPSPSASLTRSATPAPTAACPPQTGGQAGGLPQLVGVAVTHEPGADRIVFTFDVEPATPPRYPQYRVQQAKELISTSGQPVKVDGSTLFQLTFQGSSTVATDGTTTYKGSNDIRPATTLVKEVRLVEDFERVMVWGAGLDRLVCPLIREEMLPGSTRTARIVVDLPTPP